MPGSATPSEAVLRTRRQPRRRIASSGSSCSIPRSGFPRTSACSRAENARRDRSYVSFEEGIDRRYEESVLTTAPRELVETELREHLRSR